MEGAKPEPVGHMPFYDINMEGFGICVIPRGCHMDGLPYAPLILQEFADHHGIE
jgi:hypothetical protein